MRSFILCVLAALALGSCVDTPVGGGTAPMVDTNWTGEVRMTKGDTTIRLCGSGKVYRLSGPDMDTLAYRYVHARMNTGQWMKVWCYGHLGTIAHGNVKDSALFAVKFQHLDASLHCDPIPDPRVSGDWRFNDTDPRHPRDIHLHLFTDGAALMMQIYLHSAQPPVEEDGIWGLDVENRVNVTWPQREQTMLFTWDGDALTSTNGLSGKSITLRKEGAADRLAGSFGRAARWLASTATAQGRPTRAEDLLPTATIAELFPQPSAMQALRTQALDTFAVHADNATLRLDAATTVRDYALLLRVTPPR